MTFGRRWVLALALATAAGAGCPASGPCEVLPSPAQTTAVASPSAGDGLVPVDSMVWLRIDGPYADGACMSGQVELRALSGGLVEVEQVVQIGAPARTLIGWRPLQELSPNTDYELRWDADRRDSGVVSFRTGEAVASAPPPPIPLRWTAEVGSPTLGTTPSLLLDYDDYVEFEVDAGRFVLVATAEEAQDSTPESVFRLGELAFVWSAEPLPTLQELELQFATLDLAGNLSPWSPPVPWQVPGPNQQDSGRF